MDQGTPRSVIDFPVQVSDNGSVIVVSTDSEQRDLHYDADGTGWQGRSIPNSSIGGSKLRTPASSTGPRRTPTPRGGGVIGCGAPPPPPHVLFCADEAGFSDYAGFSDEGDNDDEEFPTEALEVVEAERIGQEKVYSDLEATRRLLEQHARDAADLESKLKVEAEAKRNALRARLEVRRALKQQVAASDVAMEAELAGEAKVKMNSLGAERRKEHMQAVGAMVKRYSWERDDAERAHHLRKAHDEGVRKLREEFAAECRAKRAQLEKRLRRRRKAKDAVGDKSSGVSSEELSAALDELAERTVDFTGVPGARAGSYVVLETFNTACGAEAAAAFLTLHT